jgi:hypothetical protein
MPDFIGTTYQNEKNTQRNHKMYQMATKYTKWPQNIPNGHKIYQMAIKYRYQHLRLQDTPKFTQIRIWFEKYAIWQPYLVGTFYYQTDCPRPGTSKTEKMALNQASVA